MMPRHIILSVLCLLLLPGFLCAQARHLKGKILIVDAQNTATPAGANLIIQIDGQGNPVFTDSSGEFRLPLPKIYQAKEKVSLTVDKPGWCILHPSDGDAFVPEDLEKGSVEVWLIQVGHITDPAYLTNLVDKWIREWPDRSKQNITPDGRIEKNLGQYI